MTRTERAWAGFVVAPGLPALMLYIFGRFKGYGDASVVGPLILAFPAYASALVLGIPVHLLLRSREVRGVAPYTLFGAAIGFVFVAIVTVLQTVAAWNLSTDNSRALTLWKYSGRYVAVAIVYGALASMGFWLIAIRNGRASQRPVSSDRDCRQE